MSSPRLGVFGGSGFYSFLDDVEELVLETPYGPPSAPLAVGRVDERRGGLVHAVDVDVPRDAGHAQQPGAHQADAHGAG